jgi:hypothetical protein
MSPNFRPRLNELRVLKRQHKFVLEDLGEEVSVRKYSRSAEPNIGLLERAYASTIVPRVMGASMFNQSEFRKRVIDFNKATNDMKG